MPPCVFSLYKCCSCTFAVVGNFCTENIQRCSVMFCACAGDGATLTAALFGASMTANRPPGTVCLIACSCVA